MRTGFLSCLPKAVPGTEVVDLLDLDDAILDIDITPNRADALSMRGSAYEVAAHLQQSAAIPGGSCLRKNRFGCGLHQSSR